MHARRAMLSALSGGLVAEHLRWYDGELTTLMDTWADAGRTGDPMPPLVHLSTDPFLRLCVGPGTARHTRDGLSVLVAPEGTRHGSGELGPFKKGAFRMAMKAGVPIIPIVFRNVLDVAQRDERMMHPATVDVAVLEPILLADWTVEELEQRIESVRQRFLDTLADWPHGATVML